MRDLFCNYMRENNIYCSIGYKLLSNDLNNLPNTEKIKNKIVEIPLELDEKKIEFLINKVKEYEYKYCGY